MTILTNYDLLLFDLDGLLVNTEELHCTAYAEMCAKHQMKFPWDFSRYFQIAEKGGTEIRDELYKALSELYKLQPDWAVLYEEKRQALFALAETSVIPLMPGVEHLLMQIQEIPRAMVTHSPRRLVESFARAQPILNTIPTWFCREDYTHAKPSPDGFITAIKAFGSPKRVLGFEDAVRGVEALKAAGADAVLVGHPDPKTRLFWQKQGVIVIDRIDEILLGVKDFH